MGFGAVEKCDAAAVLAQRIRRNDTVAGRPTGVDTIRAFCLLEDSQVHVGLGHPPECHLQPPLSAVLDVVGAESNRHLPTLRLPGRVAHILPTVPKYGGLCQDEPATLVPAPLSRLLSNEPRTHPRSTHHPIPDQSGAPINTPSVTNQPILHLTD